MSRSFRRGALGAWNMDMLSGVTVIFIPIEELLFAVGFVMYWSGMYEYFNWCKFKVSTDWC